MSYYADDWLTIHLGDCAAVLAGLPAESVNCVVTSPPYWGLRDYGTAAWDGGDGECDHAQLVGAPRAERPSNGMTGGKATVDAGTVRRGDCRCGAVRIDSQLGLEPTPDAYVAALVSVFREVRRVLRKDGTVWLNLGDSYAGPPPGASARHSSDGFVGRGNAGRVKGDGSSLQHGLKPKDRVMIPARVALALQADGWWLRDEVVWHKPNPMPSSVRDRTTPAHEMVYLLTKSARYWYDADAIAGPGEAQSPRQKVPGGWDIAPGSHDTIHRTGRTSATYRERNVGGREDGFTQMPGGAVEWARDGGATRNKRSVWTVATQPYPEAHFATFPEALIEPMILAGCPEKVCPECGAPWERVTESSGGETYVTGKTADKHAMGLRTSLSGYAPGASPKVVTTLGWRPTCAHDAVPVSGVTLDPFGGSGTVAVVAQRLGRKAVLIDLSAEYVGQMIERIGRARGSGGGPALDMDVPFRDDGLWGESA